MEMDRKRNAVMITTVAQGLFIIYILCAAAFGQGEVTMTQYQFFD